jgi:cytochrome c biogenesis protein CcdA
VIWLCSLGMRSGSFFKVRGICFLMKRFLVLVLLSGLSGFVVAEGSNVYYFYSTGCSHCANVAASGVLEEVDGLDGVSLAKLNLHESQEYRDMFNSFCDGFGIEDRGWPFVVVECDGNYNYLMGDSPIIENLAEVSQSCEGVDFESSGMTEDREEQITWGSVVVAALIDSVNPCAFGVLIFLMASLLRMGSSRRALRAGMIYSGVVFLVYFLVGLFLYHVIDRFSSSPSFYYFYLGVAILIGVLGLVQLKDVVWYGRGFTLKISDKVKPLIEKWMAKGTLGAIIVLGVIVSLFELPCTGEIYLGILTVMSLHKVFGVGYLLVYNLIFVLPLVVLTWLIYRGTSTERLQSWTVSNRKYMKLISGLLLLGLAGYIFVKSVGFV